MTESQTVWMIVWQRAVQASGPFEIDDVTPNIAATLNVSKQEAQRKVGGLLGELERLPEGEQFFRQEGNAIVVLPEFLAADKGPKAALQAYPFET